ncbi:MAG TPA: hypothetical protein VHQ90_26435 [Thermoanaerobaculia bacterium]|nr:hypothetical protein [Thermoanaerobaculia bacterium]
MNFVLQMVFMGLAAFVLPGPGNKGLTVVVPDATQRYFASDGNVVPPHRALLVFLCANVVGGCDSVADKSLSAMSALYQTWDMKFDPNLYGARELTGMDIAVTGQQAVPDDIKLDEVAQLSKCVSAETAKIDDNFLKLRTQFVPPYTDAAAARASFAGIQALVTERIKRSGVEVDVPFAPLNTVVKPGGHHQKLAEETTVSLQVVTGSTITLTPFRPKIKTPPPLQLQPVGAAPVRIWVLNLAVCDRWTDETVDPRVCLENRTHEGAHHFERYYELSQSRPLSVNRPVPGNVPPPAADAHDRPICPQALFTAP